MPPTKLVKMPAREKVKNRKITEKLKKSPTTKMPPLLLQYVPLLLYWCAPAIVVLLSLLCCCDDQCAVHAADTASRAHIGIHSWLARWHM